MKIPFGQSRQSTIGIEWELAVVDGATLEQVPEAEVVLGQVEDPVDGPIRREYLTSMIEIVSGVHDTPAAAVADLQQHLEWALDLLEPRGLTLLGAGAHPSGTRQRRSRATSLSTDGSLSVTATGVPRWRSTGSTSTRASTPARRRCRSSTGSPGSRRTSSRCPALAVLDGSGHGLRLPADHDLPATPHQRPAVP
ncbi:MAG: hypothetical protein IPJ61_18180 [Tessaracoccus sp.]|nr:hypothetical protein [Tessaracoccus sp.]